MAKELNEGGKSRSHQTPIAGPWDGAALAVLREWDPLWADQCCKVTDSPWTNGILPRKDVVPGSWYPGSDCEATWWQRIDQLIDDV